MLSSQKKVQLLEAIASSIITDVYHRTPVKVSENTYKAVRPQVFIFDRDRSSTSKGNFDRALRGSKLAKELVDIDCLSVNDVRVEIQSAPLRIVTTHAPRLAAVLVKLSTAPELLKVRHSHSMVFCSVAVTVVPEMGTLSAMFIDGK